MDINMLSDLSHLACWCLPLGITNSDPEHCHLHRSPASITNAFAPRGDATSCAPAPNYLAAGNCPVPPHCKTTAYASAAQHQIAIRATSPPPAPTANRRLPPRRSPRSSQNPSTHTSDHHAPSHETQLLNLSSKNSPSSAQHPLDEAWAHPRFHPGSRGAPPSALAGEWRLSSDGAPGSASARLVSAARTIVVAASSEGDTRKRPG